MNNNNLEFRQPENKISKFENSRCLSLIRKHEKSTVHTFSTETYDSQGGRTDEQVSQIVSAVPHTKGRLCLSIDV